MKEPEYTEGPEDLENFKAEMKVPFKVPEEAVVRAEKKKGKKQTSSRAESVREPEPFDKD
jgi:hypothetical protein